MQRIVRDTRKAFHREMDGVMTAAYPELDPLLPKGTRTPTPVEQQHRDRELPELGDNEMLEHICTTYNDAKGRPPSAEHLTMLLQEYTHRFSGIPLSRGEGGRKDGAYTYVAEEIIVKCGRMARE